MMEANVKNKWQIRLAVLLIFVVGCLAGALAMNFYHTRQSAASTRERVGKFARVLDQLHLTPEQRAQVQTIFDEARAQLNELRNESRPKFRDVRQQTDARLQAVLTPEQWQQFQQLTSESRGKRSRGKDRDGKDKDNKDNEKRERQPE